MPSIRANDRFRERAELRAMQVHDCYLVVETAKGSRSSISMRLHERILYERLRGRVLAGGVEVQRLLMPLTVEMTGREAAVCWTICELLAELGLMVQDFGGTTVALTGRRRARRKRTRRRC